MKYTDSTDFQNELQELSDVLELINFRKRTIESYLQAIHQCCFWLKETYDVSIDDASIAQLRAFLLYLKRKPEDGGRGYAPRSINIYNCAIKKYYRFVLRRPLSNDELPICKIDHPLPSVPSKKDVFRLIYETRNLKHRTELAVAYGAALRLSEVTTLKFKDISFSDNTITIAAEYSKSRYAEKVELPQRLRGILLEYYHKCYPDAQSDDWLFPGMTPGSHISKGSVARVFYQRVEECGWSDRGYSFHSLRHAHALAYYQAGADLFQVQQRLRHRSITSTLVYVRLDARQQERKHIENPFDDPRFQPLV